MEVKSVAKINGTKVCASRQIKIIDIAIGGSWRKRRLPTSTKLIGKLARMEIKRKRLVNWLLAVVANDCRQR